MAVDTNSKVRFFNTDGTAEFAVISDSGQNQVSVENGVSGLGTSASPIKLGGALTADTNIDLETFTLGMRDSTDGIKFSFKQTGVMEIGTSGNAGGGIQFYTDTINGPYFIFEAYDETDTYYAGVNSQGYYEGGRFSARTNGGLGFTYSTGTPSAPGTTLFQVSSNGVYLSESFGIPIPSNGVTLRARDIGTNNNVLSIYAQGAGIVDATTPAATHNIAIDIGGTLYYLLASNTR